MRIVFDTNIFIAGALKGGFIQDVIHFAAVPTAPITIIASEAILDELVKKLREKAGHSKSTVEFYINYLKGFVEVVEISEKINVVERVPDDNKILECAVSGNADLIVSSDQDLIDLKVYRGIGIIHPKTLTWTFPEHFKKWKKKA